MSYPVSVSIAPQPANRNRLTTAFRLLLALPHLILVGGVVGSVWFSGSSGLLGAATWVLAIVSWFTIVLGGRHIPGIRTFTLFVMRWRVRSIAYSMLLVDDYPPFGDGDYPVSLVVVDPPDPRDRLTVGFRLLLALPHAIALFFVLCFWWIVTIVAWFAILITGRYPEDLYAPCVGAMRWLVRFEAYLLLLVDDYPPFSME